MDIDNLPEPIRVKNELERELKSQGQYDYNPTLSYCHGVGMAKLKIASLLFDRIYVDDFDFIQARGSIDYMRGDGSSQPLPPPFDFMETRLPPAEVCFFNKELTLATSQHLFNGRGHFVASKEETKRYYNETFKKIASKLGLQLTQVSTDASEFHADHKLGDGRAWSMVIDNLPVIDDEVATWDQILDFRRDKNRLEKVRGLRKLHKLIASADSEQHAIDITGEALDQYRVALKRQGFQFKKSLYEIVVDKNTVIAAGAAGLLSGTASLTAIAAGAVIVGNMALRIAETKIAGEQLLISDDGTAALIYDIKKSFGET